MANITMTMGEAVCILCDRGYTICKRSDRYVNGDTNMTACLIPGGEGRNHYDVILMFYCNGIYVSTPLLDIGDPSAFALHEVEILDAKMKLVGH